MYFDIKGHRNIEGVFDGLSEGVIRSILQKGTTYGGFLLKQAAKEKFEQLLPSSSDISEYTNRPMSESVSVKQYPSWLGTRVNISSPNDIVDWRAKLFETGTEERYTKKGYHTDYTGKKKRETKDTGKENYRGKLKALNWFSGAYEASWDGIKAEMIRSVENNVKKALEGNYKA